MKSALERLQEIREGIAVRGEPEPGLEDPIGAKYPLDELGEPCPTCGGKEKWRWLDERLLCRPCLIRGEPPLAEGKGVGSIPTPGRPRQWW
jgi:hypothetical protein